LYDTSILLSLVQFYFINVYRPNGPHTHRHTEPSKTVRDNAVGLGADKGIWNENNSGCQRLHWDL